MALGRRACPHELGFNFCNLSLTQARSKGRRPPIGRKEPPLFQPYLCPPLTSSHLYTYETQLHTTIPWAKAKAREKPQLLLNAPVIIPSSVTVGTDRSARREVINGIQKRRHGEAKGTSKRVLQVRQHPSAKQKR
eukprot:scaffold11_cov118-Skeletonema_dohrnii-CCMP3373.AAC.2